MRMCRVCPSLSLSLSRRLTHSVQMGSRREKERRTSSLIIIIICSASFFPAPLSFHACHSPGIAVSPHLPFLPPPLGLTPLSSSFSLSVFSPSSLPLRPLLIPYPPCSTCLRLCCCRSRARWSWRDMRAFVKGLTARFFDDTSALCTI